jgi:hypothetical protein
MKIVDTIPSTDFIGDIPLPYKEAAGQFIDWMISEDWPRLIKATKIAKMYVDKYTNTEFEEQINEWSDMIHKDYKNVYVDLGKASG